jgi:hypothetical protein
MRTGTSTVSLGAFLLSLIFSFHDVLIHAYARMHHVSACVRVTPDYHETRTIISTFFSRL